MNDNKTIQAKLDDAKFLAEIKWLTAENSHTRALRMIADRAGFHDLAAIIRDIQAQQDVDGHLTDENNSRRNACYAALKSMLCAKFGGDDGLKIYRSLPI